MYARILVAYDGSGPSKNAVERALALASRDSAALTVLTVAAVPRVPDDVETEAEIERTRELHRTLLEGLEERWRNAGIEPSVVLVVGHPAQQIVRHAEEADLLVLGHAGHGVMDRWLASVAHHAVSGAPCDVLVVR